MLRYLRNQSKSWVAKLGLSLLVLVFVVFGFGSFAAFVSPDKQLAQVGEEVIYQKAFEAEFQRQKSLLQRRFENLPAQQLDRLIRPAQVLNQMIERQLILQYASNNGFEVSAEAIFNFIKDLPPFQKNGKFDLQVYETRISQWGYSPEQFKSLVLEEMLLSQIISVLQQTTFHPPKQLDLHGKWLYKRRDVDYVEFIPDSYFSSVQVTDEDKKKYYETHKALFLTQKKFTLAYLEVNKDDLNIEKITADEIEEYHRENFADGETRTVSHIMLNSDEDSTKEQSKQLQKIADKIKKGELTFAKAAEKYSEDIITKSKGGLLGEFDSKGILGESIDKVVWSLKINQVSEPVISEQGVHLLTVSDIQSVSDMGIDALRDDIEKFLIDSKREDAFLRHQEEIEGLLEEFDTLEDVAASIGEKLQYLRNINNNTRTGILAKPVIMKAVLSEDVQNLGYPSGLLLDESGNTLYVVAVQDVLEPEQKKYDEVSKEIGERLVLQKANKMASSDASSMLQSLKDGSESNVDWISKKSITRFDPSIPRELINSIFSVDLHDDEDNSLSDTADILTLFDGRSIVYRVKEVKDKSYKLTEQELQHTRQDLARNFGAEEFSGVMQVLRSETPVEYMIDINTF